MRSALFKKFLHANSGATAIEYGLLAAMVAMVILSALVIFGNSMENLMSRGTGSAASTISAQAGTIP